MGEKNVFAYKPFLPLNISDFNFLCENGKPPPPPPFPEKRHPLFPSNLPLKVEALSSPKF